MSPNVTIVWRGAACQRFACTACGLRRHLEDGQRPDDLVRFGNRPATRLEAFQVEHAKCEPKTEARS